MGYESSDCATLAIAYDDKEIFMLKSEKDAGISKFLLPFH